MVRARHTKNMTNDTKDNTTKLIAARKVRQNGKLWDVLGVGCQQGKVIFTGTLREVRKVLGK